MKKLIGIILLLCTLAAAVPEAFAESHEVWSLAPDGASGMADADVRLNRALRLGKISVIKIPELGDNIFFGTVNAEISNGGYKGNKDMSLIYYYLLLDTDSGFVVLDCVYDGNEHYSSAQSVLKLSGLLDFDYYKDAGLDVPYYMICPTARYSHSSEVSSTNYYFITDKCKIVEYTQSNDRNTPFIPAIKDKKLYGAQRMYASNKKYVYNIRELLLSGGTPVLKNIGLPSISEDSFPTEYTLYSEGFKSNIEQPALYKVPNVENLYAAAKRTQIINENGTTQYVEVISVYRCVNNEMVKIDEKQYFSPSYNTRLIEFRGINGLDESKYQQKGYAAPVAKNGDYFILSDGSITKIELDSKTFTTYDFGIRDGVLTVVRNRTDSSYIQHVDENNRYYYWHAVCDVYFDKSGNTVLGAETEYKSDGESHGLDGYYKNYRDFVDCVNMPSMKPSRVTDWYSKYLTNVFPDGRYAQGMWVDLSETQYEMWYVIYNPDGTVNSRGPTGSITSSVSLSETTPIAIAVNNSKMVLSVDALNKGWMRELYRSSVSEVNSYGEYITGGSIGEKNLTPPEDTDTEPVNRSIDFNKKDLPIGYNIRDNVIGSGKLDAELRETVNSIRLNDITIVTDSGYASGSQNTGTRLDSFSRGESMGGGRINVYTNGQKFNWYCSNTESITPGTYSKSYVVGDKRLYVTINVIEPPSADGKVTVVF